ncbi:MAG TPA: dihydroorotate oxidase [Fibrobacteraceae bacterium]|nr:dihydroorotate oxidase [Fibrobacteraceae bacterium]
MISRESIPFNDYDYPLSKGDRLLALIRAFVRSPEMRHHSLTPLSRVAPWLGYHAQPDPALEKVIRFRDRSNPIHLGNPFILAAGSNKTGEWIPELANIGFGGVTVGTATHKARIGNTHRPRLGMIEADRAIHNSMGLNNPGIDVIAKRVDAQISKSHRNALSVGISVAETPGLEDEEEKLEDVVETFRKAYKIADYLEINVSCPNTGEQRLDLDTHFLERLFGQIMQIRKHQPVRKALYAKLSPDLTGNQILSVLELLKDLEVNGLVLFNTFPSDRARYLDMKTPLNKLSVLTASGGKGGLSGRILYRNTFRAIEYIHERYPDFSLMACGGIDHGLKAWDLLRLGADAVQCYSVVAYRWFAIHQMRQELLTGMHQQGVTSLSQFPA